MNLTVKNFKLNPCSLCYARFVKIWVQLQMQTVLLLVAAIMVLSSARSLIHPEGGSKDNNKKRASTSESITIGENLGLLQLEPLPLYRTPPEEIRCEKLVLPNTVSHRNSNAVKPKRSPFVTSPFTMEVFFCFPWAPIKPSSRRGTHFEIFVYEIIHAYTCI